MSQFVIPLIFLVVAAVWLAAALMTRRGERPVGRLAAYGGGLALIIAIYAALIVIVPLPMTWYVVIPLLVTTIVQFGFIIALVSKLVSGRISTRAFLAGMLTVVGLILAGVLLMFQPITPKVFNLGFDFMLIALIAVNIWSHITPRPDKVPSSEH